MLFILQLTEEELGAQKDKKIAQGHTTREGRLKPRHFSCRVCTFTYCTRANTYMGTYYLPDIFYVKLFNPHNKPRK